MSTKLAIKTLLLDIEGTICPISFVKDILYPYAKKTSQEQIPNLAQYFPLTESTSSDNPTENALLSYLKNFPANTVQSADQLVNHITTLINNDVKDPALKTLQGYLWKSGYESGKIKAPLFDDVVSGIKHYSQSLDHGVSIYSSGSVAAQLLLFKHVENPSDPSGPGIDITSFLTEYFDTVNAGSKLVKDSYKTIAEKLQLSPEEILFLSDNPLEIDAAVEAGFNAYLTVRPGNAPVSKDVVSQKQYKVVTSLTNVL